MNVYCLQCGARLFKAGDRWLVTSGAACTNGSSYGHLPDPLDLALRRLDMAKDAVSEAQAAEEEAQEDYNYLRAVRVPKL